MDTQGLPEGETSAADSAAPPPPAVPQPPQPAPPPQYGPPPLQQQYGPPPGAPPPMPGMPYGYIPADGNTSGMGEGYVVPPSVKGWTFAGFIPYGIFAFANNSAMWGAFGLIAHFTGLSLVYCIVLGIMGREIAWKSRRFTSLMQFEETMAAWNKWGIIILCVSVFITGAFLILYFTMFIGIFAAAFSGM